MATDAAEKAPEMEEESVSARDHEDTAKDFAEKKHESGKY